MRKQDLIAIIVLGVVFAALGIFLAGNMFTPISQSYSESSTPAPIESGFDEQGVEYMQIDQLRDYTVIVDGVETSKNLAPFTPLDQLGN